MPIFVGNFVGMCFYLCFEMTKLYNINENLFIKNSVPLDIEDKVAQYPTVEDFNDIQNSIAVYCWVAVNNVMVTEWSYEALLLVSKSIIPKNKSIIIPCPNFVFYNDIDRNINKVYYWLDGSLSVTDIIEHFDSNVAAIYLSNPNNPLWVIHSDRFIVELLEFVRKKNIYLIIDEAYIEYAKGYSSVALFQKDDDNLIIIRTFSKALWQASLKLWYIIADHNVLNKCNENRKHKYSFNKMALLFWQHKLKNIHLVEESVIKNNDLKKKVEEELERLWITYIKSFANFVCLDQRELSQNKYMNMLSAYPDAEVFEWYVRLSLGPVNSINELIKLHV